MKIVNNQQNVYKIQQCGKKDKEDKKNKKEEFKECGNNRATADLTISNCIKQKRTESSVLTAEPHKQYISIEKCECLLKKGRCFTCK